MQGFLLRSRRRLLLVLATWLIAAAASGSWDFPGELTSVASMPCTPLCDVCHLTALGGPEQIRPGGFAATLRDEYGLVQTKKATIAPAIRGARAAGLAFDTDGDGMNDAEEVERGRNPNAAGATAYLAGCERDGGVVSQAPVYGCARIAAGERLDDVAAVFAGAALAVGAGVLRLRRSKARVRGRPLLRG